MQARRALNDHEKRIVAYHEAGHALCAELLPAVDRVHRISIVPRGSALGFTLNLPDEDRYLKTREELIDRMTMLLGGRAAEQLVFGSVTTGAAGDYDAVTALAAAMVDEYAMGTRVTLRRADGGHAAESTLRLRDEEQADLADGAYRAALGLLSDHRRWLDALAAGAAGAGGARAGGHRPRARRPPARRRRCAGGRTARCRRHDRSGGRSPA